jgi:sugar/nucleoside kinase (ribokinase family)
MFDLVGIGNPVYDTIITPFSRTDDRILSGCSTNGCLAAKRLGFERVGLIGRIGSDFADRLHSDLNNYGITASLDSMNSETGGFHLEYDWSGDRTLEVLGVAQRITAENVPDEFLDSRFFIVGPILGEVDLDLIEYVKTSSNGKLLLDPQGLLRLVGPDGKITHRCERDRFRKILGFVDFVKPNEPESVTITDQRDHVEALRQLREMGAQLPIITLAERGSMLMDEHHLYQIPTYSTTAIDPTGAGDVYGGSFIVEYARTHDCVEAALFASAAASLMVEQVGPNFKLVPSEVERRRQSFAANLVKWDTL